MADFGQGITRTLSALHRQFASVIWLDDKPPMDSELNLVGQMEMERQRAHINSFMPSGFILDPTRVANDFHFDPMWADMFQIGSPRVPTGVHEHDEQTPVLWACVNGWIIPLVGTNIPSEGQLHNLIKLYPAPESDTRIDFVFLEVWATRVDPNPATANKPSPSTIWKYGNVEYGGTNLPDDLEDPALGMETTSRLQVQYRIRVHGSGVGFGASVTLDVYPDGLGDPNIHGQGTSTLPVTGNYFTNMREELGDPSLWRAGDGDPNNSLGTYDGYSYAIPICAVFRRNSGAYVAVQAAGNPNQNGSFLRTPGNKYLVNPLMGSRGLTVATLTDPVLATTGVSADAQINVTGLIGSGLDDVKHVLSSTFLVLGTEIIGVSAVDAVSGTITIPSGGRGRYGTHITRHPANTPIRFFTSRPDGRYADEITPEDILDLRKGINPGDWDFHRILEHNLTTLAKGELRSTWKKSGAGDTEGTVAHEVDYLLADGTTLNPNHTEVLDGPDGIRTVWSGAATMQPEVTILLDNDATTDANGVGLTTADQFDTTVGWDVGPDFHPVGFMNYAGGAQAWMNGSTVLMFIGGDDGTKGARGTFRDGSTRAVRFVMPKEYWKSPDVRENQAPITLRFLGEPALETAPPNLTAAQTESHVGPMYPYRQQNFERPFIALGGLLNETLKFTIPAGDLNNGAGQFEIDLGLNFDTAGGFFSLDANGQFENNPAAVTTALLRNSRTLYGMLTDDGRDRTGASSEVYLVIYGDDTDRNNNGAFKVVGAGTVGYTRQTAGVPTVVVVEPLSADFTAFQPGTGKTLTVEVRSHYHNSDDVSDYATRYADLAIVLTDIAGLTQHPWFSDNLWDHGSYDLRIPDAVQSKMLISLTLQYHPGRSGMARIPDDINRFAMRGGVTDTIGAYLQQSGAVRDTSFPAVSGMPSNEAFWDFTHVQIWNRLPALGLHAPYAPSYGGNIVGRSEQDREKQLFVDKGSKTFIFRPFRDRRMTLHAYTTTAFQAGDCMLGTYSYPSGTPKDGMQILTGITPTDGKEMAFAVPREFMPRFGRQDIPNWEDMSSGAGPFLPGINHLFRDTSTLNDNVFNIIGGEPNVSGTTAVYPMFMATGTPTQYGTSGTFIDPLNNRPFYAARKTTDINPVSPGAQDVISKLSMVRSADLGDGLRGIQLPPYIGIARLYGVYDARDYVSKGGRTFAANRYSMEVDPATNLLRRDADAQSLFILPDGAQDLEPGVRGCHTYIVPENVIDITKAANYVEGDDFADYNYVIEMTSFVFAQGWIDRNNFVLVRKINGAGATNTDGDDPELENIHMVIPCPAGNNDHFYVAHNRTVYQGDPYMTRAGNNRTVSDYEHRYGEIPVSGQHALRTAVQQYDGGVFIPEAPNPRAFEVLSSMDFCTTLGTGKMGGALYPGTSLDVGYTEDNPGSSSRMPLTATSPAWRVNTRAFTEGQEENTSRAALSLELLNNTLIDLGGGAGADHGFIVFHLLDGSLVPLYGSYQANVAALKAALSINDEDIFVLDQGSTQTHAKFLAAQKAVGNILPGQTVVVSLTEATHPELAGAQLGDTVIINPRDMTNLQNSHGMVNIESLVVSAVPGAAVVNVGFSFICLVPFHRFAEIDGANVRPYLWDVSAAVAAHQFAETTIPWTGAQTTDAVVVNVNNAWSSGAFPLAVRAEVSAADTIMLRVTNTSAGGLFIEELDLEIAVLQDIDLAAWTLNAGNQDFDVRIIRDSGSVSDTANTLKDTINDHSMLQTSVRAYNALGTSVVDIEAIPVGDMGNGIKVSVDHMDTQILLQDVFQFRVPWPNTKPIGANVTASFLLGGEDYPFNAGIGTSQLKITGMTERFPMGVLLKDSDFLCENPLGDNASAFRTFPAGPRPQQTLMPLTMNGDEYDRFLSEPGSLIAMADGSISISSYTAYTTDTPTGTKKFRLFRGGGSAYMLMGINPGGPLDWMCEALPKSIQPVLKGGILVCKALLVRNFYEEALPGGGPYKVSDGDEIQMVILTYGILGNGTPQEDGINLQGNISPTGYGEGYAAADRYRLAGHPMFRAHSRQVRDPAVPLAPYPEEER